MSDFLQELYSQELVDDSTRSPAETLRAQLRQYSQKRKWNFLTGSSPSDISLFRKLRPDRAESSIRRLIGTVPHGKSQAIIAPTDIMAGKYMGILFDDPRSVSLQSSRIQNLVSAMQTHETAEAYERSRGVIGQFGGHASESVIRAEMGAARNLGGQTLADIISLRKYELSGIRKHGLDTPHWKQYSSRMGEILNEYGPIAKQMRQSEYISKITKVSGGGTFYFPESYNVGSKQIGSVIGKGDQAWNDFLFQGNRTSSLKTVSKGSRKTVRNLILGGTALWLGGQIFGINDYHNKLPEENRAYNMFDGFQHGGVSSDNRKLNTPFGSKYDRIKVLAKMFGETIESFKSSGIFQKALHSAKEVRHLGEGRFASATLMETEVGGQSFQFVRKRLHANAKSDILTEARKMGLPNANEYMRSLDLRHESKMMAPFKESKAIPSVYKSSQEEVFMEYMPGEKLSAIYRKGEELSASAKDVMRETVRSVAQKNIQNLDIHEGNVLFDKASGRVSWIDWGQATKLPQHVPANLDDAMNEVLTPLLSPKLLSSRIDKTIIGKAKHAVAGEILSKNMEGMRHGGMAARKRKLTTDFGSRWQGLLAKGKEAWSARARLLPTSLQNIAGTGSVGKWAGVAATPKDLRETLVKDIMSSTSHSLKEKSGLMQDLHGFMKGASDDVSVVLNPGVLRQQAKEAGTSYLQEMKGVLLHEEFHKKVATTTFKSGRSVRDVLRQVTEVKNLPGLKKDIVPLHYRKLAKTNALEEFLAWNVQLRNLGMKRPSGAKVLSGDVYKAIEGLTESGTASELRKFISDYGSGYRGLGKSTSIKVSRRVAGPGRARRKLTESAQDLRIAQEQIWKMATEAGKGHSGYAGSHVKQLSRFGGRN